MRFLSASSTTDAVKTDRRRCAPSRHASFNREPLRGPAFCRDVRLTHIDVRLSG